MTAIVVGLARGGTSATAAVVDALGVPMDTASNNGHFDTRVFKGDLINEWGDWHARIEQLNAMHKRWGMQLWNNTAHVALVQHAVRRPHLLIVCRDLAAMMRAHVGLGEYGTTDMQELMAVLVTETTRLVDQANIMSCPTMLLSFGLLRSNTDETVKDIREFLGLPYDAAAHREAVARVKPAGGYLVQS